MNLQNPRVKRRRVGQATPQINGPTPQKPTLTPAQSHTLHGSKPNAAGCSVGSGRGPETKPRSGSARQLTLLECPSTCTLSELRSLRDTLSQADDQNLPAAMKAVERLLQIDVSSEELKETGLGRVVSKLARRPHRAPHPHPDPDRMYTWSRLSAACKRLLGKWKACVRLEQQRRFESLLVSRHAGWRGGNSRRRRACRLLFLALLGCRMAWTLRGGERYYVGSAGRAGGGTQGAVSCADASQSTAAGTLHVHANGSSNGGVSRQSAHVVCGKLCAAALRSSTAAGSSVSVETPSWNPATKAGSTAQSAVQTASGHTTATATVATTTTTTATATTTTTATTATTTTPPPLCADTCSASTSPAAPSVAGPSLAPSTSAQPHSVIPLATHSQPQDAVFSTITTTASVDPLHTSSVELPWPRSSGRSDSQLTVDQLARMRRVHDRLHDWLARAGLVLEYATASRTGLLPAEARLTGKAAGSNGRSRSLFCVRCLRRSRVGLLQGLLLPEDAPTGESAGRRSGAPTQHTLPNIQGNSSNTTGSQGSPSDPQRPPDSVVAVTVGTGAPVQCRASPDTLRQLAKRLASLNQVGPSKILRPLSCWQLDPAAFQVSGLLEEAVRRASGDGQEDVLCDADAGWGAHLVPRRSNGASSERKHTGSTKTGGAVSSTDGTNHGLPSYASVLRAVLVWLREVRTACWTADSRHPLVDRFMRLEDGRVEAEQVVASLLVKL